MRDALLRRQFDVPPLEGGVFSLAAFTGAIAAGAAADSEVFQFRWTSATKLGIIQRIELIGMRATTAFAAGAIDLKATIARAFTVAGTGGTALTITTNNNKLRTVYDTIAAGELRVATTAALGAGTKTLDANDIGGVVTHSSAGPFGATPIIGSIYLPITELFRGDVDSVEQPLTLAVNEGFVIRATVPATGVWNLGLRVKWSEALVY